MAESERAIDVYKAIIDQLANETRTGGAGACVARHGVFSKAPAHRKYNEFIAALAPAERTLLAEMLQDEREGAIHDVLAVLSWWIDCRDVGWTHRGEPMPVDVSGMGLHADYVGRRDGWQWPAKTADDGP